MSAKRVLVVGASFGGLAAAEALPGDLRVTVVDPEPLFQWLPNIHELVSGLKLPRALTLDRRRLVARAGHRFVRAGIRELDAANGRAVTDGGRVLRFEAAIVAVGGVHDTFGVPGADRHALPFKSVRQCEAISARLEELFRHGGSERLGSSASTSGSASDARPTHAPSSRADTAGRRGSRALPVRVCVIGGGIEGVEALGEVLRRYRGDDRLRATIIEAAPRLMPTAPAAVNRALAEYCRRFAVDVLTGARVASVAAKSVRFEDGTRLRSDLTVWTAGARPAPLLVASGLAPGPRDWAPVAPTLESAVHPNVFVVGDAAALPEPLAKQAYHALDMGTLAADNVCRFLNGRRLRSFRASPKPTLVTFGDLDTFMIADSRVIAAPALAAAKEAVFQLTMARLDPPTDGRALASLSRRALGALARAGGALGVRELKGFLRFQVD